jgi:DNA-binding response OmpR family regulator
MNTRIEELEEENRQLRELLAPKLTFPVELALSRKQNTLLAMLFRTSPNTVKNDRIFTVFWGDALAPPSEHAVKMQIFALRKKLRDCNIVIQTNYGEGYFLTKESKILLAEMLKAMNN